MYWLHVAELNLLYIKRVERFFFKKYKKRKQGRTVDALA